MPAGTEAASDEAENEHKWQELDQHGDDLKRPGRARAAQIYEEEEQDRAQRNRD